MRTSEIARRDEGLTVIELMVVIAAGLLVVTAAVGVLFTGQRSFMKGEAARDVQANLRLGIDQMSREVRQAIRLTTNSTATTVEVVMPLRCGDAGATCVAPYDPNDLDLSDPTHKLKDGRTIRYWLDAAGLHRSVNGTESAERITVAACQGISPFQYLNDTGSESTMANVTRVQIQLCGTVSRTGGRVTSASAIEMQVRLRNWGLGQ